MRRRTARTGRGRLGSGKTGMTREQLRKKSVADYRAKRRAVLPHVFFALPKDPTPAARKKLNKYHTYLHGEPGAAGILQGVRVKVRRKDPKKLKKLQTELGQGELPGIKYAYVPSMIDPETGVVVPVFVRSNKIKADVIRIAPPRGGEIQFRFEALNHKALMRDPEKEVARVVALLKAQDGSDDPQMFRIRSNDRTVTDVDTDESIVTRVRSYMREYKTWKSWLEGVTMETAGRQTSLQKYHRARIADKERKKQARKINLNYMAMLTAIDQGPPTNTETLAMRALGSPTDPSGLRRLNNMKKAGLVNGDDNRWWNTRAGSEYLRNARSVLPIYMH